MITTIKKKSWLWYLTFPFAHANFTTLGKTVYCPRDVHLVPAWIMAHEEIHARQQAEVGIVKFVFLYLFCLPFWWNPWRWKWEWEAYIEGSKWTPEMTIAELESRNYGWLRGGDTHAV